MKHKFDELSFSISKNTTHKYSTSFSLGIMAIKPSIRAGIYAIYGFVRLADEIVDSFHGYDKQALLHRLHDDTLMALQERISLNPILNAFQDTVIKNNIDRQLIEDFLFSMEMDLREVDYNSELYNTYIYGSAEVVGLMCLQVFTEGNKEQYLALQPYARKLGSAFQKINFLRDIKDDFHILGRTYFPNVDFAQFDNATKKQIEQEIELEFLESKEGIKMLPHSSRFGVYLAYKYYWSLFRKIKRKSSHQILMERVRVPNLEKAMVALKSFLRYKTAML